MAGLLGYASSVVDQAKNNVQGLLSDPKKALMDMVNTLAANAAASQAKTKAAWATRDPDLMAQNALDSSQTALGFAPLGITAYHGSPHLFDKFDSAKIGTGEGAQAYGHGLYLAENPGVAKSYMSATVPQQANSIRAIQAQVKLNNIINDPMSSPEIISKAKNDLVRVAQFLENHQAKPMLYKTDIPEEAVSRFLDWDKPLSQQSKEVIKALEASDHPMVQYWAGKSKENPAYNGADLMMRLGGEKSSPAAASELLKAQGIPGIRYLDGGSRSAGQGSSNFVAFDPEMIRILERNGQSTGAAPWQPGEWRGLLGNN